VFGRTSSPVKKLSHGESGSSDGREGDYWAGIRGCVWQGIREIPKP
jgi:hypothetical protein